MYGSVSNNVDDCSVYVLLQLSTGIVIFTVTMIFQMTIIVGKKF